MSVIEAELSDSETSILFRLKGKEATETVFGYNELIFDVFARGYLLNLLSLSSLSYSSDVDTDK